jgi:hypothetical protein
MICALTHDDPVNDCRGRDWARVLGPLLVVGIALAAIATTILLVRRRRQHS